MSEVVVRSRINVGFQKGLNIRGLSANKVWNKFGYLLYNFYSCELRTNYNFSIAISPCNFIKISPQQWNTCGSGET